jgi:SSS family solute:Na+ symporter
MTDPKQTLPVILLNFGKRISPLMGIIFCAPIILVSIGSGSAVTKIVTTNIKQLNLLKKLSYKKASLITIAIALAIASTGNSIIDLIVSFYAIYVASVIIPFIFYVLQETNKKMDFLPTYGVKNSLFFGALVSLSISSFQFIKFSPVSEHLPTYIMIGGIIGSLIGVCTSTLVHLLNNKKFPIYTFFAKKHLAKI